MMGRRAAVLALLSAGSAGGTILFLGMRPEPPPPSVPHPTAARVALAARHLEALSQGIPDAAPDAAPASGKKKPGRAKGGPRTLRLSEDDINVYLAGSPVARKLLAGRGIRAVQVTLSPPAGLGLVARVDAPGGARTVKIDGTLSPDPDLGLHYEVTQAQAGRLPLPPRAATAQAQTVVAGFLRRAHGHLPIVVQSVKVVGKTLLVTGTPPPPAPKAPPRETPPDDPATPQ